MLARILTLSTLLIALQTEAREEPDTESLEAFRFDAAKLEVGRVYHYEHSNIDGSRPSRVSLYWAAEDTLESLKWADGWDQATLVVAQMNWKSFSVKGFQTYRIDEKGERSRLAKLDTVGDELVAGGLRCELERLPWHSYDFDLASLNVSLRFLKDPEELVVLGVADVVQDPTGVELRFKGDVELEYLADEEREGIPCRKYSLDGPGLELRGGLLWAAKTDKPYFVDFELDLPDEPGFTSGKLRFLESAELSADEWKAFVLERRL